MKMNVIIKEIKAVGNTTIVTYMVGDERKQRYFPSETTLREFTNILEKEMEENNE